MVAMITVDTMVVMMDTIPTNRQKANHPTKQTSSFICKAPTVAFPCLHSPLFIQTHQTTQKAAQFVIWLCDMFHLIKSFVYFTIVTYYTALPIIYKSKIHHLLANLSSWQRNNFWEQKEWNA